MLSFLFPRIFQIVLNPQKKKRKIRVMSQVPLRIRTRLKISFTNHSLSAFLINNSAINKISKHVEFLLLFISCHLYKKSQNSVAPLRYFGDLK